MKAAILIAALLAAVLAVPVSVLVSARRKYPRVSADCLIALGCKVHADGRASNTLRLRCETAAGALLRGDARRAIVCGGQGSDEPVSEAERMRGLLEAQGIAPERILLEDRSVNTSQNLRNAKALMEANGLKSAVIVTSDYHLARALRLARDAGMTEVCGLPAPSPKGLRKRIKQVSRESVSRVLYWERKFMNGGRST